MIETLPTYVSLIFGLATILTVAIYLYAIWAAVPQRRLVLLTAGVLIFLLGLHGVLAFTGFYLEKTVPPRFPLAPIPTTIILLILFFTFAREGFSRRSLQILTVLSVVRIPVELVLWWLYQNGQVPELMTFEGRNLDILAGLTAPIIAWLAFRGDKINWPFLIVWNVLAFGSLINIVTNAILSLETPFQQFGFEQPNRGVLYFPFIWLPAIIVPIVFASHVVSLWELFKLAKNLSSGSRTFEPTA